MVSSLYELFKTKYKESDKAFFNRICSFVGQALRQHDDIKIYLDSNDIQSVAGNVIVELLEKDGNKEFEKIEQINAYLSMMVRNATSKYLAEVISPMKIVNPKGGESKKRGPVLTQAVNARRQAIEVDSYEGNLDFVPAAYEDSYDSPVDELYCLDCSSTLLSPFVDQIVKEAHKNHLMDLLSIEGGSENASQANVLLNKCLSENMKAFLPEEKKATQELSSHLLSQILPKLNKPAKVSVVPQVIMDEASFFYKEIPR